jgi:ABC-2 type transport system permease protein
MMHSVFTKTLYDKRWFIAGWTLGMTALAALMTTFYPAMHQDGSIDALVANMPKAFEGLVGNLADLRNFPSYIASQLFDIRMPLIGGIMAIILGLGLSSSEEESGELRTMTALPISRAKLLLQKWLALAVITAIVSLGTAIGIYAVLPFLEDAAIDGIDMVRLVGACYLLMLTLGTVPFAAGMISGKRAVATGIGIFVVMGSFILSTFGTAVDWLEKFEKLSLIYYFPAVDIVKNGIDWANVAVLAGICLILLAASLLVFRRRDIG